MKKILFPLVALVCSMSMNAQVMKIMKGTKVVVTYTADQADNVVFEEAPAITTTGTAQRTGGIDVNWVQLWENGPKFAEYNVGAANNKAEDYGGYYAWGGSQDKVDDHNATNDGSGNLTSTEDTATKLWGSNWRMPTSAELEALLANCDVEWTTINGVNGRKFTGTGAYSSNSVFLPAAGLCYDGNVDIQGYDGYFWSSSPDGSNYAYYLSFYSGDQYVNYSSRDFGCSVRAVLEEAAGPAPAPATTGTAKATINSTEVNVNWIQLWEDGPKFAEYNVGAANNKAEDYGGYYCWGKTTDQDANGAYKQGTGALTGDDDTATKLWGSNWRMPTQAELEALLNNPNCTCTWTPNYNETGVNGLLCTGKDNTAYASNSVFLPAAGYCYDGDVYVQGLYGYYWSSTPNGSNYAYNLYFNSGLQNVYGNGYRDYGFSVRAVLAE